MRYYLAADLAFVCIDPSRDTDDGFDSFTDAVMDALVDLEDVDPGIHDADLTATIARRTAAILMGVDADSRTDANRLFSANVRTALHAAGCGTPDWPEYRPTTQRPDVREADHSPA